MKDLTRAHIDEYKASQGAIRLEGYDSGWLLGVIGGVEIKLDPMISVRVGGTYADGSGAGGVYEVPQSVVEASPLAIMRYLIDKYGIKPS
jgi:hypothetical protein